MLQNTDESRTELIASLQQQTEELAELNHIALALTSELDLQRLLQMITDAARKVTSASYAAFFLLPEIIDPHVRTSPHTVNFNVAAISTEYEPLGEQFRHLGPVAGYGVLHPVFWEGATVLIDDVLQDSRYVGLPFGHIPVRSFLGVHLRTREGSHLGAFLIGHTLPDRFRPRHVELMEVLSTQAAVSIHNAQLIARERITMEAYATRLEQEVHERTLELEQRNKELRAFATSVQQLHSELTEAQKRQMLTEERSRIAQELHDRVQQTLFTIGLKADWLKGQIAEDIPTAHALNTIKQLASLGTAQVRDAIFALSSTRLPADSLVAQLYTLTQDIRESSAIDAELTISEWERPLPSSIENVLYTVAQEALSNVRRHAHASMVVVTLQVTRNQAVLVVQDNGSGVSPQTLQSYRCNTLHLGLKGMHQRIEELGGQFMVTNGEEAGLIVKVTLPL